MNTMNTSATLSVGSGPPPQNAGEPQTYVSFELAGQAFAADVRNVREILDFQPICRLPNATHDLLGIIDIRGEAVAIIDLCDRLALHGSELAEDSRIIVFELGSRGETPIGVVADRVLGVIEITSNMIEPAPDTLTKWDDSAVCGIARIGGRLTMLLALEALFQADGDNPFAFD